MHKIIRNLFAVALLLLPAVFATAQDLVPAQKVEMADGLRANGKIYVVVAVVVTILLGILIYLWQLDRKIGKLEKEK
jgi:protein-S-isoprenylcysteine O-methyltransferase Ste14